MSNNEETTWWKNALDSALAEVITKQLFAQPIIEARPVWQLPKVLLIAKVKVQTSKYWLITGRDSPTDILSETNAATAQEAARHFALKWQLAAEQLSAETRLQNSESNEAQDLNEKIRHLIHCAESLHELAHLDHLWQKKDSINLS